MSGYTYPASNGAPYTHPHPHPRLLNSTAGLNIHASSFQTPGSGLMIGVTGTSNASLLHPGQRSIARKYDSEPLHGSNGNRTDRYQSQQSTIHSPPYANTTQSNTRPQSRTSSISNSQLSSHLPSPRPNSPPHTASQQQTSNTNQAYLTQHQHHQQLHHQQQGNSSQPSSSISPPLASSSRTLLPTPSLIVTPPSAALVTPPISRSFSTGHNTSTASTASNSTSPSPATPTCCVACGEVRSENAQLRAQMSAYHYELQGLRNSHKSDLQKMRSDVTKALVAFESRLHLQLQQQLGFKPDLEPMQNVIAQQQQQQHQPSAIVTQALSQIQATLDKFDSRNSSLAPPSSGGTTSPGGSPWHTLPSSKRTSLSWNPVPGGIANILNTQSLLSTNNQVGWVNDPSPHHHHHQQQQSNSYQQNSPLSPPQLTSSINQSQQQQQQQQSIPTQQLLANLNLGNINLASLSHLLNAVNGLQNQLSNNSPSVLHSPSPIPQHHHHPSSGGGMTEERLILLAIEILSVHGAVPVGKMGSLLHKAANDHTLPQMLKERYGGLKKMLDSAMFVRTVNMSTRTITLSVSSSMSINEVKQLIEWKCSIPLDEQRLVYGVKDLDSSRSLKFYDVAPSSTLQLMVRNNLSTLSLSPSSQPPPMALQSAATGEKTFQIFVSVPSIGTEVKTHYFAVGTGHPFNPHLRMVQAQAQVFTLGTDHPYNPSLSLSVDFLAANPHIRPPEPQPTIPLEPALPPVLGSNDPTYQVYWDSTPTTNNNNNNNNNNVLTHPSTSLLNHGSLSSHGSSNSLHRDYSSTSMSIDLSSLVGSLSSTSNHQVGSRTSGAGTSLDRESILGALTPDEYLFEPEERNLSYNTATIGVTSSAAVATSSNVNGDDAAPGIAAGGVGLTSSSIGTVSSTSNSWDKLSNTELHTPMLVEPKLPSSVDGGVDGVVAAGGDDGDLDLPLHPIDTSPSLGATSEASANANATFFSRLLS